MFVFDPNKKLPEIHKDIGRFQICIFSEDSNPQIKNKKLILGNWYSKIPCMLRYEKHFTRNGKEIMEFYTNDILDTYFETSKAGKREIVEGFGAAGDLFTREIKHFRNGKPFKTEIIINNADGTTHCHTDYH